MRGEDMKSNSRIRQWLKWGGTIVSLIILLAWAVSIPWSFKRERWTRDGSIMESVFLQSGYLGYFHLPAFRPTQVNQIVVSGPKPTTQWSVTSQPNWHFFDPRATNKLFRVYLGDVYPLWIPLLVVALPTALLWWRD